MKNKSQFLAAFILFIATSVSAEPQFYLVSTECKSLTGSLHRENLQAESSALPYYGCSRNKEVMTCAVEFMKGGTAVDTKPAAFNIVYDTRQVLFFESENHAEFFALDTSNQRAVLTARLVDDFYLGEKVCIMKIATPPEYEMLKRRLD